MGRQVVTNPVGNRKLRTVALMPEQDYEMELLTGEISKILHRHYPVSEFIRALIDEALSQKAKAKRLDEFSKEFRQSSK